MTNSLFGGYMLYKDEHESRDILQPVRKTERYICRGREIEILFDAFDDPYLVRDADGNDLWSA